MAENVYEGMFILDANRFARDAAAASGKVEKLIKAAGAELLVSRLWEERRLAYTINGQRKGAYWITYFRLPTSKVSELTRQCELKEGILRQLFVRLPDSLVDHILDHAKGNVTAEEPAEEKPSKPPAAPVAEVAASS